MVQQIQNQKGGVTRQNMVELERERTKDLNKWQSFSESLLATNKEIIEVYCKNNIKQKQEA